MLLALLPVPRSVGNSEVFLGLLDELLPESLFELGVLPVLERLFGNVVAVFDVLLFGSHESFEIILETALVIIVEEIWEWLFFQGSLRLFVLLRNLINFFLICFFRDLLVLANFFSLLLIFNFLLRIL